MGSIKGTAHSTLQALRIQQFAPLISQRAGHFERIHEICCLCVTEPARGRANMARPETDWSRESRLGREKYNLLTCTNVLHYSAKDALHPPSS